jgi:pSer/pThr/pTyr-binding forkhead associated (FHA) protein
VIKLVVVNRNTNDKKVYQLKQNTIVFGRAANCDVMLESETVSRRHAQLIVHRNLLEIEDLGSGNGTLVNQEKIASKERVPLKRGDQIRVEEFTIDFESDAAEVSVSAFRKDAKFEITDPDILEIKMIKKILGAFDHDKRPGLIVVTTPFQNLRAHVEDEETDFIVGRDLQSQLAIDHQTVSRKHAKLSKKWGGFVITDLGSKNGTFVNGEKVVEKGLNDGDEIVFGTIKAVFRNPQEFDIDAISKSMAEERKAHDKIQEAAKLEGEERAKAPEAKPEPIADAKIKGAAENPSKTEDKKSAETHPPKEEKKDDKKSKPDETKKPVQPDKKEDAGDILDDIDQSDVKPVGKKAEAAKTKSKAVKKAGLSSGEKALLLFGLAVLGLLVAGLYLLLK